MTKTLRFIPARVLEAVCDERRPNKPWRTPDGPKKFAVCGKDGARMSLVRFGDPNLEIKRDSAARRKNFRARHGCGSPGPKTKAKYWACKTWERSKRVSDVVEHLVRTPLLIENSAPDKHVRNLHIFDMDGSLVLSPEPHHGKEHFRYYTRSYTHPRGRNWDEEHGSDWWSNPKSLTGVNGVPPFKIKPIEHTLRAYHAAKADPHGHVVVMTGRVDTPEMRDAVSGTLHKIGVRGHQHGHDLFLKPPSSGKKAVKTHDWKGEKLRHFHAQHPHLEKIHMWDDREDHLAHFSRVLKDLKVNHELNHVRDPRWTSSMPSHT